MEFWVAKEKFIGNSDMRIRGNPMACSPLAVQIGLWPIFLVRCPRNFMSILKETKESISEVFSTTRLFWAPTPPVFWAIVPIFRSDFDPKRARAWIFSISLCTICIGNMLQTLQFVNAIVRAYFLQYFCSWSVVFFWFGYTPLYQNRIPVNLSFKVISPSVDTPTEKKSIFFPSTELQEYLEFFKTFFFKEILFLFRKHVVWSKNAKSTSAKSKIWFENRDLENHRYFTLFCYEMLPNRGQKGWILMSNSS